MLGAIIGDVVESRWEFNPTNDYNSPTLFRKEWIYGSYYLYDSGS